MALHLEGPSSTQLPGSPEDCVPEPCVLELIRYDLRRNLLRSDRLGCICPCAKLHTVTTCRPRITARTAERVYASPFDTVISAIMIFQCTCVIYKACSADAGSTFQPTRSGSGVTDLVEPLQQTRQRNCRNCMLQMGMGGSLVCAVCYDVSVNPSAQ